MPRPLILALLLLVGVSVPLTAQEPRLTVSGRVVDDRGAPLARAAVVEEGSGRILETDHEGHFVLRQVTPGRRTLRVSLPGYSPATRVIEVGASGLDSALVITLVTTPLTLPGIQVTGTAASSRDPLAVTQSTMQLSGRQLERELGSTLAETLGSQPGITIRFNGPAAAAPVIRGLTGDRVLILQDGQRTADLAGSADDHGVTIDPLLAQRIEVVRGPATLLYGNNALGGVVHMISGDLPVTRPSRASVTASAQTESAFPGIAGGARAELPLGESWVLTLRGGGRSTGDTRIGRDPELGRRLENTEMENLNAAAGLGYIGDRHNASAAFRLYDFEYGIPTPPDADPVSLRGDRREGAGRAEFALPSPVLHSITLDGTVQDYVHDEIDVPTGSILQSFALQTGTVNLTLRQGRLGPIAEGAWGISGLYRDYAATGVGALTPPAESRSLGLFGFQEIDLTDGGLALQLGGRYDIYRIESKTADKFGPGRRADYRAFSGSVGLRIPLAEGISLGTSYAGSFRAPTVEELFSGAYHVGTGTVEFGDPGLEEERGHGLEGVLRVQTERLNGQIAAYRNAIDNYVYLDARGDTIIDGSTVSVLHYTQNPAIISGGEASLEWAASRELVLRLSGDIVRATMRDGTPLSFIPPARLGFELHWDDGTYAIGGGVLHAFRQDRTGPADELSAPAYTNLRFSAGLRHLIGGTTHSLTIRGENLGDRLYRDATSRIKDFAPNPGRNISLVYRLYY